jgi:hypothetical protein
METIKIEWFPKRNPKEESIAQIYSQGLEYACANRDRQCSHFIYCKDFLHDAVWSMLYGTPIEIYGFKFDPAATPLDLDLTRMLIANSSDEHFHAKIANVVEFLNQIETDLKLRRTKAYVCDNPPDEYVPGGVFLLEGSQRWMNAPPLLSLYTLLVRCGFVHRIGDNYVTTLDKISNGEITPYQENDQAFVKESRPGIDAILKLGYRKIFYKDIKRNYPKKIDTSLLHHHFGIRGYAWATETKSLVPYWHRKLLVDFMKENDIVIENLWVQPKPKPVAFDVSPPIISKDVKTTMAFNSVKSLAKDFAPWKKEMPEVQGEMKGDPALKSWDIDEKVEIKKVDDDLMVQGTFKWYDL